MIELSLSFEAPITLYPLIQFRKVLLDARSLSRSPASAGGAIRVFEQVIVGSLNLSRFQATVMVGIITRIC